MFTKVEMFIFLAIFSALFGYLGYTVGESNGKTENIVRGMECHKVVMNSPSTTYSFVQPADGYRLYSCK